MLGCENIGRAIDWGQLNGDSDAPRCSRMTLVTPMTLAMTDLCDRVPSIPNPDVPGRSGGFRAGEFHVENQFAIGGADPAVFVLMEQMPVQ